MSSILVTGGTGRLGGNVVTRLLDAGHRVRIASRGARPPGWQLPYDWARVDYRDGTGLAEAMDGVDAVVHCATGVRAPIEAELVDAARRAGEPLLVLISIVGVDRVPMSYYRTKLASERLVECSGLPHTIQRATQFHDLLRVLLAGLARPPVMLVPELPFQPIDVRDVAARLAELAAGAPLGRAPDMGGPQVSTLPALAREYLRAAGRRRPVLPLRLPGKVFGAYRAGGHLAPDHTTPGRTFAQYLADHGDPARLAYRTDPP